MLKPGRRVQPAGPVAAYRLLIAEDADAAGLAAAIRRLSPSADVIAAANADEALAAVATQRIDVVLIDFSRPGAQGLELAALVRRARGDIPMALVSSELQGDAWRRTWELDAIFIPRPATEEALAAFLARAELQLAR